MSQTISPKYVYLKGLSLQLNALTHMIPKLRPAEEFNLPDVGYRLDKLETAIETTLAVIEIELKKLGPKGG